MKYGCALAKWTVLVAALAVSVATIGLHADPLVIPLKPRVDDDDRGERDRVTRRVRPDAQQRDPSFQMPDARPLGLTLDDAPAAQAFRVGSPMPTALAAGDFDGDGIPDLVCGYASLGDGFVTLHRGNVGAIFPRHPDAVGEAPFLSPGRVIAVPQVPDFIHTGDFDGDGRTDIVVATLGSDSLDLLPGDGRGGFAAARRVTLDGQATTTVAGDINRRDGLTDLVVGMVTPDGAAIAVFEGPEGALAREPERIALPAPPTALALGRLDDEDSVDLVVGAGNEIWMIAGRDRRLSLDAERQQLVEPARKQRLASLANTVEAIAVGDFVWDDVNRPEIAVLAGDGSVELLERTTTTGWRGVDTRSLTDTPSPGASLVTARVSGLPLEEVVALDPAARRLHALLGEVHALSESATIGRPLSADLDRQPLAVLPMRLNRDAQHDLIVLFRDDPDPWTITSSIASTFTVTNLDDSGNGSLRDAINDANGSAGADLIQFAIPVGGVPVITLLSPLPALFGPVTIDGYTQGGTPNSLPLEQGSDADLRVVVDGETAGLAAIGIDLAGGASTVRGLVLKYFDESAILIRSNANIVEGNFIGVDVDGLDFDSNRDGVQIDGSANNTIGGTAAAARNLIGGNIEDGIDVFSAGSNGNVIQGNLIGVDRLGTGAIGNASDGVQVVDAGFNTIGGTAQNAGNVISDTTGDGIDVGTSGSTLVQGNRIGVTADGVDALGNGDVGIEIGSQSVTVGGTVAAARNIISGNAGSGVLIDTTDATLTLVQGNFIGTDVSGTLDLGNEQAGLLINNSAENTIGGVTSNAGNVISGNSVAGVGVQAADSTGNVLQGNRIGTDHTGTVAIPNDGYGVRIVSAPGNEIGGTASLAGNVISGNMTSGLLLLNAGATGNQIRGNLIGLDAAGTGELGNGQSGIQVFNAVGNTIGHTAAGNVISGNDGDGVKLEVATTTGNSLIGNKIGSDINGEVGPGNGLAGVRIVSARDNSIGGIEPGQGNVIAGNGAQGVIIDSSSPQATGDRIAGNDVFDNALLGIDLGGNGVTLNDTGDIDSGPNELQNFPLLTSATLDSMNNVTIAGNFLGRNAQTFRIEFFSSPDCDASNYGEGSFYLGSTNVTTVSGLAPFNVELANRLSDSNEITATATDANGNTSEFSECEKAVCGSIEGVFRDTIRATDRDTLSWETPTDIRFAKGNIYLVGSYSVIASGLLRNATSLDVSGDNPGPFGGAYYVVRNAVCGSWQTTLGAEPARDTSLP